MQLSPKFREKWYQVLFSKLTVENAKKETVTTSP